VPREAVVATTRRSDLLTSLVGGELLDAGSAMHRVLAGRPWRTAPRVQAGDGTALALRSDRDPASLRPLPRA
jgi:hypothetical protein